MNRPSKTFTGFVHRLPASTKVRAMRLYRLETLLPRVDWLDTTLSTNDDMRVLAAGQSLAHGSAIVCDAQTAGRGRQGRNWVSPAGTGVACSLLLKPAPHRLPTLLPLLAGVALARALRPYLPGAHVNVKWPNDVLVQPVGATVENGQADELPNGAGRGGKIAGILCELLPSEELVVGAGVNILTPAHLLPTEKATSLVTAGAVLPHELVYERTRQNSQPSPVKTEKQGGVSATALKFFAENREPDAPKNSKEAWGDLIDAILAHYVKELLTLVEIDMHAARQEICENSATLGRRVRAVLPDGQKLFGRAVDISLEGSLQLNLQNGNRVGLTAADVEHLRHKRR